MDNIFAKIDIPKKKKKNPSSKMPRGEMQGSLIENHSSRNTYTACGNVYVDQEQPLCLSTSLDLALHDGKSRRDDSDVGLGGVNERQAADCDALWDSVVRETFDKGSASWGNGDRENDALWDDIFELLTAEPTLNEDSAQRKRKICSSCSLNYYDNEKHRCFVSRTSELLWGGVNDNENVADRAVVSNEIDEDEEGAMDPENPLTEDEVEVYNDVLKEKGGERAMS